MSIINILTLVLIVLVVIIAILSLIYLNLVIKQKSKDKKGKTKEQSIKGKEEKTHKEYTEQSIFNFMEFDRIEDNMIVQKNGKKFLMVIECQGINYDLMSEIEKNSVEIGFMKVLNTLRTPIQIYVQTRTINLENSLSHYRIRLENLQSELSSKQARLKQMESSNSYTQEKLNKQRIEVMKQENLYAYTKDIVLNTERMSLNKNILRKKYYIIMSYFSSNSDADYLGENEVKDLAFSDLYTRCQSLIRVLSSTEVMGKVLNSDELADLLYNAYNRDEAETFGIGKAIMAGYDNLYITAQDVLEKRMNAINLRIEKESLEVAEEAVLFATNQKELEQKEENIDDLISEFAKKLIDENEQYLGEDITRKAKAKVDKITKEKGEKENGKKAKARNRA